jgi:hypothetical protein
MHSPGGLSKLRPWVTSWITPRTVVAALAAFAFFLLFQFIALSDFRELALNRFQDDSYYYLLPAWQLAAKGFFTFDGIHPTYGFQPLWMLILSLQAIFTPDKVNFIRIAALLGAGFYCLAGIALYYLVHNWMPGWRAVLAPVFWLVNPPLISLYMTGKENALYAFLLISAAALVASTAGKAWTRGSAIVAGILVGLMVLARVNALVPAVLLLGVLCFGEAGSGRKKAARLAWTAAGLLVVVIPWMVYAQCAFGAIFPNSGSAKLIGGWAAAAIAAHGWFPWIPADTFVSLLPGIEKLLFFHADDLTIPTGGLALPFFLDFLPDVTLGYWKDEVLGHVLPYRVKFILLALAVLVVAGWMLLQIPALRRRMGRWIGRWIHALPAPVPAAVLGMLLLAAVINGLSDWLLLPAYLYWASWYAVPETLALVLLAATAFGLLADFVSSWVSIDWRIRARGGIAVLFLVVIGIAIIRDVKSWAPLAYDPARGTTQAEVYRGTLWMGDHLPQGVRVGSYSAGLIGYFANGFTVINLDGLANTPDFVTRLLPGHFLYARGLAVDTPLKQYLRDVQIGYLANYDPVDRIQSHTFMGLVTEIDGSLVYEGNQDIVWGPGEPVRRFGVVEITR